MWIALSLLSAFSFAFNNVVAKRSVDYADVVLSTVVFRILSALLLLGVVLSAGPWPASTPGFVRALLIILPAEIAGMVLMALALRAGDLSLVQPILGLIPVFVTLGGVVVLEEVPSAAAAVGILLVAAGVYTVGLEGGRSMLDPLRGLASSRASWYALGAASFWSVCSIMHKIGVAEVGPLPWGVAVVLTSSTLVGLALPLLARGSGGLVLPKRRLAWGALMVAGGLTFAVHVYSLQTALHQAPAGYVIGISSLSTMIATVLGIVLLGERSGVRHRVAGALLVTAGAVMIAVLG